MITPLMLTGRSTDHLVTLSERHHLQFNATKAFLALQQQAAKAGFKLMPASSFRSFERQLAIWNGKFEGTRPVLDAESQPIDIQTLSEGQRCEAILKWSALPGASRHHWGTEIDFYDPFRLPNGQSLQLEPWEYEQGGYFAQLNNWLTENMSAYDFIALLPIKRVILPMSLGISVICLSLMKLRRPILSISFALF